MKYFRKLKNSGSDDLHRRERRVWLVWNGFLLPTRLPVIANGLSRFYFGKAISAFANQWNGINVWTADFIDYLITLITEK